MLQMTFESVVMEDYYDEDIVPEIQKYWPQIKRGFRARANLYKAQWVDMNDFTHLAYIAPASVGAGGSLKLGLQFGQSKEARWLSILM